MMNLHPLKVCSLWIIWGFSRKLWSQISWSPWNIGQKALLPKRPPLPTLRHHRRKHEKEEEEKKQKKTKEEKSTRSFDYQHWSWQACGYRITIRRWRKGEEAVRLGHWKFEKYENWSKKEKMPRGWRVAIKSKTTNKALMIFIIFKVRLHSFLSIYYLFPTFWW